MRRLEIHLCSLDLGCKSCNEFAARTSAPNEGPSAWGRGPDEGGGLVLVMAAVDISFLDGSTGFGPLRSEESIHLRAFEIGEG